MKIILDTNIWISFLIGHQLQTIRDIITDNRFEVYLCPQLTNEILDVASRNKISRYISHDDISDLLRIIRAYCLMVDIEKVALSNIRDRKDLYLLSLAETIEADYIVSGDADLTVLGHHKDTQIIVLAEFKKQLMQ